MSRTKRFAIPLPLIVFLTVFGTGCGANEGVLRSGKVTPIQVNISNEKTTFDKDLDAMRTAGFAFIYIVRRKDGGVIDAEDVGVIKLQTTDTNRRVKADNDRAVIIGSNKQVLRTIWRCYMNVLRSKTIPKRLPQMQKETQI